MPPGRFNPHKDVVYRLCCCHRTFPVAILWIRWSWLEHTTSRISTVVRLVSGRQSRIIRSGYCIYGTRELEEETGIVLSRDNFIGRMTRLAIPISRFEVDPILFMLMSFLKFLFHKTKQKRFIFYPLNTIPWHHIPTMDIHQHGVILKIFHISSWYTMSHCGV